MTAILSSIRYALRTFRRNPVFTMVAVMSLALGIGANTAVFTLLDQLVLRLLPVKEPERLVMIWPTFPHFGNNAANAARGICRVGLNRYAVFGSTTSQPLP